MRLGWFKSRVSAKPPVAPSQSDEQATATLEPAQEPVEIAPEAPAVPAAAEQEDDGWFSEQQLLDFDAAARGDEDELARLVACVVPFAGREEALFRYQLSRSVCSQDFELPLLPTTAAQVMRLGRDPKASVKDYVSVVQSDPSLVSAIVRMANSSFFSAASACASLDQAIVRIGLSEVEKVATIHIFRSKVFRVRGYDALAREIVQHGIGVSIAAQWVLRRVGTPRAEAFLGGLFHDVGKLMLLQAIGRVQQKLGWTAPPELVQSAFTAFHTAVGERVCITWELPATVCQAVRWHHDAHLAAHEPIGQAVYLGNRIVHSLEAGDQDAAICEPHDPVMLAASHTPDQLRELRNYIAREIEAVSAAVNVSEP